MCIRDRRYCITKSHIRQWTPNILWSLGCQTTLSVSYTHLDVYKRQGFLRDYPIKIYKQRVIEFFIVDFYCAEAKLVSELDGSQHYTEQGQLYDHERSCIIEQYGIEVLRFSIIFLF